MTMVAVGLVMGVQALEEVRIWSSIQVGSACVAIPRET